MPLVGNDAPYGTELLRRRTPQQSDPAAAHSAAHCTGL
jgi:hypothetical protein